MPSLRRTLAITLAAAALLTSSALADGDPVRYTDPSGLFSLTHPSAWTVAASEGSVELYGEPFATFVQVGVYPVDMLPTSDVDELVEAILAGLVETWEDAEVAAAEDVELGGLAMRATAFAGVDPRPVRVERRGELYLAVIDEQLVMVVHTVPVLVAGEVMPEIEALLTSLTLTP